ncbi:uncharacterized protein P884DRAFT_321262, partial [Thermothelomyces heterothallicus CBS 202.75]|uniref:uncharacterized protein n=1 Tax=Thermothelomyces heterothallicus CBS 202.75 TaxID=1149848 RepID=UPI003742D8D5
MFTLVETVLMVIVLRGLRYCYGSNAIFKEPLLYGDQWTQREWAPPEPRFVERQRTGLSMSRSIQQHSFGWWRPGLFQWEFWRFRGPITRRLLVGNLLLYTEYTRRWRAVRNVRNVQIQL